MDQPKTYETTIKLGATTETDDPETPEIVTSATSIPTIDDVRTKLQDFIGAIQQRPPQFSAIKIGGRRACDRMRDGQLVELKPRTVNVYAIDLLHFDYPYLKLRIDCGRGTYIRAIARDLGEALGVGGYLTELRRTRIGEFTIELAVSPEQLTAENLTSHLRTI